MKSPGADRNTRANRILATYAWGVLAFMVLVVLWGAVVRATGSGAGCGNHWPLCNGDYFPSHPRLATIIEFTHRSMSGILTTLVVVLAIAVFQLRPKGDAARKAALWVVALLISEALLGAVLVKGGYVERNTSAARVAMQCIHFTNTMLLLAALSVTAWWLQQRATITRWGMPSDLTLAMLLLTLMVGATGSVAALADTLFPSANLQTALLQDFAATAPLIVRMRWIHPAATMLLTAAVIATYLRHRTRKASLVALLLLSQLVVGVADVLLLAPTWMQVVHLLGADAFWIALVIFATETVTLPLGGGLGFSPDIPKLQRVGFSPGLQGTSD